MSEDLPTDWPATIKYNLIRSYVGMFACLLLMGVFGGLFHGAGRGGIFYILIVGSLLGPFLAGAGLICGKLSAMGVPFIGIIGLWAIALIPSDPILYIFNRVRPGILPEVQYKPFQMALFVYIHRDPAREVPEAPAPSREVSPGVSKDEFLQAMKSKQQGR